MNKLQISLKREMLEKELRQLPNVACINCQEFKSGWCNKYQANPPEDVVKEGCDEWLWDEIPF